MRWVGVLVIAAGCGRIGFDATGGDAGLLDAAPACPPTAVFCEGFESGALASWPRNDFTPGVSMEVTDIEPHVGRFALDAFVPMIVDGASSAIIRDIPRRSAGVLAIRLWVRPRDVLVNFDQLVIFYNTLSAQFLGVGCDNFMAWSFTESDSASTLTDHGSSVVPTVNAWACLELVLTLDAGMSRGQLFVNDTLVTDEPLGDPIPNYDALRLGLPRTDVGGGHVVIDDVVVSDRRIGCQ